MRILSWDVGIYNLCYCLLEKDDINNKVNIISWDIVNLVDNEKMKKNKTLLFENIPRKLQEIPELLNVDYVVIENQPSLKNPQMKSIQMILYSYFLILGKIVEIGNTNNYISSIDFCSASNKLKVYDGPKIILEKKIKKNIIENIEPIIKYEKNELEDNELENNELENNELENNELENNKEKKKKPPLKYADKKKLAIAHSLYYVEKDFSSYKDFFNSNKKKDDLSDSLLQGLYYIKQMK
jgi:hypothetical protein